eukprot:scaffold40794_cov23-Tisochrysis_lutea.AAC.1
MDVWVDVRGMVGALEHTHTVTAKNATLLQPCHSSALEGMHTCSRSGCCQLATSCCHCGW